MATVMPKEDSSLKETCKCCTSFAAVTAERGFLEGLNASCKTPIAAYAIINCDQLHLRCLISSPDGKKITKTERFGKIEDGYDLGLDAALQLKHLLD